MFPPATAYLTASLRSPKALNVTTLEPMLESSSMLTSGGVEPKIKKKVEEGQKSFQSRL
jgi:hypothetical protein